MLTVENRVNGELISMLKIVNVGSIGYKDDITQPRKYKVIFSDYSPLPKRAKQIRTEFNIEHNRIDGHAVLIAKAMVYIAKIQNNAVSKEVAKNKCDNIEFLSNPLLTEEGYVNEACMNELSAAIKNMPPTYERLKDDEEWNTKRITSLSDITGGFAKWAIRQSSYAWPSGLENVACYLATFLKRDVKWDEFGYAELSLCDINKLLYDILYEEKIELFDSWNVTKKDWRKDGYDNISDAEKSDPGYGYIALDALLHNVCLDIRMERRASDEFDRRLEVNQEVNGTA